MTLSFLTHFLMECRRRQGLVKIVLPHGECAEVYENCCQWMPAAMKGYSPTRYRYHGAWVEAGDVQTATAVYAGDPDPARPLAGASSEELIEELRRRCVR